MVNVPVNIYRISVFWHPLVKITVDTLNSEFYTEKSAFQPGKTPFRGPKNLDIINSK